MMSYPAILTLGKQSNTSLVHRQYRVPTYSDITVIPCVAHVTAALTMFTVQGGTVTMETRLRPADGYCGVTAGIEVRGQLYSNTTWFFIYNVLE